ncbi:MAG: SynChlorMet cassette protein ScmC [bacterium]
MPAQTRHPVRGLRLTLADGQRWLIRAADGDTVAAAVVAELGEVMQLGPAAQSDVAGPADLLAPRQAGRELCVAVRRESDPDEPQTAGAVVYRIAAPTDLETRVAQLRRIASFIARESLARGGMLFHGALAEYRGSGFIMGGPAEVGKSTASRRLPAPWRSLSDDMTLVVPDGRGRFWAHPWPTWSRFLYGGPGGAWAVERAVPLRALFFLDQSPLDRLEPLHGTRVTALAMESAEELVREVLFVLKDMSVIHRLCSEALRTARGLAAAIPAWSLKFSLEGRFWEEIERVLPVGDLPAPRQAGLPGAGADVRRPDPVSVDALTADDSLRVVCTGASMFPTLDEPDLLEVRPCRRVRPGDVVCFVSPETGKTVVHRVVSVSRRSPAAGPPRGGIRTRGDNNREDDPWVLPADSITGRVVAAQRGGRRRPVRGGWPGLLGLHGTRLVRGAWRRVGVLPHLLYRVLARLGPFDRLLPRRLRPRPVRFGNRYRAFLKLLMGRQAIGYYDFRLKRWQIRRPFRLFVAERTLEQVIVSLTSGREARD